MSKTKKPSSEDNKADAQPGGTRIHEGRGERFLLYLTAFVCGAAVMILELLGTRVIGPFYGASIVVWTALLTTALLALSVGYLWGGRLADTVPALHLGHILLVTGMLIGLIPWVSEPVQLATEPLGLRWGALASALILFSPGLVGLGMVGPFVIKGMTMGLYRVGRTVGMVYAVSTMGSVLGTLLLGFYLLPVAGVYSIIVCLGWVMLAMAVLLAFLERRRSRVRISRRFWLWALLIAGLSLLYPLMKNKDPERYSGYQVLFEKDGSYGWVRVLEQPDAGVRWMLSGGSVIGVEDFRSGKGLLEYQKVLHYLPLFQPGAEKALLIGVGAGHLVEAYRQAGVVTDAMEIDPLVAQAAKEHFNFRSSGDLILGDARYHIRHSDNSYDWIIHDTFTGGSEPIHLMTREMFLAIRERLRPGGIMALNMLGMIGEEDSGSVASVAKTLDSVFAHRLTFISTPGSKLNDFIFFVSDEPLRAALVANPSADWNWLRDRQIDLPGDHGVLITDQFNPLDKMNRRKAESYRMMLVNTLGKDVLFP